MSTTPIVLQCICSSNQIPLNKKEIKPCIICSKWQHKDCIKSLSKMDKYVCPHCQFKHSDMCIKVIENLVPPSLIEYQPLAIQKIETSLKIDIGKLKASKDFNVYTSFIIIHCLQINSKGFDFKWPLNTFVEINTKRIFDIPEAITKDHLELQPLVFTFCADIKKKANEFGYNSFPYNQPIHRVSEYLSKLKETKIEISILGRCKLPPSDFIVSIDFIKVLSDNEVIDSISTMQSKKKIQSFIKKDNDTLFDGSKEEVNLLDIYTGTMRIELPIRGISCLHLSVFDLKSYIMLNRKKRKYKCPICGKNTRMIYIDGLILKMIKQYTQDKLLLDSEYNIFPVEQNIKLSTISNQINDNNNNTNKSQSARKVIQNKDDSNNGNKNNSQSARKVIQDNKGSNPVILVNNQKTKQNKDKENEAIQQQPQIEIRKETTSLIIQNNDQDKEVNAHCNNTLVNDDLNNKDNNFSLPSLPLSIFQMNIEENQKLKEKLKEYIKPKDFDNFELFKAIFSDRYYNEK